MTETMTPGHVAALLALCAGADDRFATADPVTAQARERAWALILEGVDPQWAVGFVTTAYSRPRRTMLTPAEVRAGWVAAQGRQEWADNVTHRAEAAATVQPVEDTAGRPKSMGEWLRLVIAAAKAGRDPGEVPRPVSARRMTRAEDARSRLCKTWRNCACDHTKCRDGFLDVEDTATNAVGLLYPVVRRCPACTDAELMAAQGVGPGARRRSR